MQHTGIKPEVYIPYVCNNCGKKLQDLRWISDLHESEKETAKHQVWRPHPRKGCALQIGHCTFCGSDDISERWQR